MPKTQIPKECISELYHVADSVVPVRLITASPSFLPGYTGRLVTSKNPNQAWETVRLKLKFHIESYSSEKMSVRMTCAIDYLGYLDDVFYATDDGDIHLENDLWRDPYDFSEGAAWECINTGVMGDHDGQPRRVFQIRNLGYDKWVKVERLDNFMYLRLTGEGSGSSFMLGKVSDIDYY
ncbi:hypothetical protein [Pseudomonas shirazensis]|uniref:hypothetical protein n=1 Tax=Pseudomonas shirazensis TaxID=2745494 RepID=UPI003D2D51EE